MNHGAQNRILAVSLLKLGQPSGMYDRSQDLQAVSCPVGDRKRLGDTQSLNGFRPGELVSGFR